MKYELGFIGGGNMAEAVVRAAVDRRVVETSGLLVADPAPQRRELFVEMGIAVTNVNTTVIAESRQIILAVKPQTFGVLAGDLARLDPQKQILISIMAGVRAEKIEQVIGRPVRIVRVMPNTPLLIGAGMSAIALGPHAREGDDLLAMQLFSAGGEAIRVDESALDAVTAVSGSGPAYLFYLAEAMTEAAESLGLSPDHARLLNEQTVLGAARLLRESGEAAAELRKKVTSPGGTTQAAIEYMEAAGVKRQIIEAIQKAAERSEELGR